MISKQFFDKIKRTVPSINIEKTEETARNTSGDIINNYGRTTLAWEIEGIKCTTTFSVMDLSKDVNLGLEFLRKHNVNLDMTNLK